MTLCAGMSKATKHSLRAALMLALISAAPTLAQALDCRTVRYDHNSYTLCEANPERDKIRLFRADQNGTPLAHFDSINAALRPDGEKLSFAMNAGMYHEDRSPVGHYIEDGQQQMRVISNPGPGNFGLLPNGIFCLQQDRAQVYETRAYLREKPDCEHATQSGPMLVIDGALHPRFDPNSASRFIRNGVGASADGKTVVFAISNNAVTFHEFGSLFRDTLRLPNALFFDGNVSRLYAPGINRHDPGRAMGPMVGVVVPDK
jgi:uncharacterized protein YigE (DUF2233 family)